MQETYNNFWCSNHGHTMGNLSTSCQPILIGYFFNSIFTCSIMSTDMSGVDDTIIIITAYPQIELAVLLISMVVLCAVYLRARCI